MRTNSAVPGTILVQSVRKECILHFAPCHWYKLWISQPCGHLKRDALCSVKRTLAFPPSAGARFRAGPSGTFGAGRGRGARLALLCWWYWQLMSPATLSAFARLCTLGRHLANDIFNAPTRAPCHGQLNHQLYCPYKVKTCSIGRQQWPACVLQPAPALVRPNKLRIASSPRAYTSMNKTTGGRPQSQPCTTRTGS